jgi:hypothetical protein
MYFPEKSEKILAQLDLRQDKGNIYDGFLVRAVAMLIA